MPKLTIFELRNYEMRHGRRDTLIELFEQHFLESQEVLGAYVIGTFRNLDDPDRFVWMRGFTDMARRAAALEAFYTGDVWRTHREAANATMIDSDNVLQLRPVAESPLTEPGPLGGATRSDALYLARTYALARGADAAFAALYQRQAMPQLTAMDAAPLALFATEHAPNSFPRLPVREGETVFVSLTRFASAEDFERRRAALAAVDEALPTTPPEIMRLAPTPRSRLR